MLLCEESLDVAYWLAGRGPSISGSSKRTESASDAGWTLQQSQTGEIYTHAVTIQGKHFSNGSWLICLSADPRSFKWVSSETWKWQADHLLFGLSSGAVTAGWDEMESDDGKQIHSIAAWVIAQHLSSHRHSESIRGRLWSDNTNTQPGDAAEEACGMEMWRERKD